MLETLLPEFGTGGQERWPTATLVHALRELSKEFPAEPPERLARAVDDAARYLRPAVGEVALLQRARALVATGK